MTGSTLLGDTMMRGLVADRQARRTEWLDSFEAAGLRMFSAGLIMADPPWLFENYSEKGEEKNPVAHYDCMKLQDICDMPVGDLAAQDCILWLWATHPMLIEALDVMKAWGFQFKTSGVWAKRTENNKLAFGTGYCLRCASEPFLIGTVGKPRFARTVRTVIEAKVREHSRKPEEGYAAAVELAPDAVIRADIFSRQKREGWISWGNEVEKFAPKSGGGGVDDPRGRSLGAEGSDRRGDALPGR